MKFRRCHWRTTDRSGLWAHRTTALSGIAIFAIVLASLGGVSRARGASGPATKSKATTAVARASLVDINHATVEELRSLPGIQDALAAKIVKNRPYANKTQLSSKGVIPAATYRKIRALIIAKQ